MIHRLRLPDGWMARSAGRVPRVLVCLVRGHQWDPAPRPDLKLLRCVRCGLTAEPVEGL